MLKPTLNQLLTGLLFLLLVACGAQDGDVTPPTAAYDGGGIVLTAANRPLTWPDKLFPTDIVQLTGTMGADATIAVSTGTSAVAYNLIATGGLWSCDVTNLAEGLNVIYVEAADSTGNSTLLQISIVVDLTGPVLTFDQYKTPSPAEVQIFAGTVNELGAEVTVTVTDALNNIVTTGSDLLPDGNVWAVSLDLSALPDGPYTVTANGTDTLDNVSAQSISQLIVVYSAAPAFAVLTPLLPVITGVSPVTLTGTVDPACTSLIMNSTGIPLDGSGIWTGPLVGLVINRNILTFDACTGGSVQKVLAYLDQSVSQPLSVSRDLPVTNPVVVSFGEEMTPDPTIDTANLAIIDSLDNPVPVLSVVPLGSRSFQFTTGGLTLGETYTVTLQSADAVPGVPIRDARGNALVYPYSWKLKAN